MLILITVARQFNVINNVSYRKLIAHQHSWSTK